MKKIFIITLALLLMLAMTACGGSSSSDSGNAGGGDAEKLTASTKTLAYFNEYVGDGEYTMEMEMEVEGMSVTTTSAVKGDMMYTKSNTGGVESIMIMKDGKQYVLDPSSKTCIVMSMDIANTSEMFAEEAANYETAAETGSVDIEGTTYDYEAFDVEGVTAKYCFDGDEMKYIITSMEGEEYTIKIISMEKGADASLFEVPGDYTVMEY